MSTFSGLGTALSSLIAQRQALDVAGQNIANANTVGYTRQRAALGAVPAATVPSMFSTSAGIGTGVRVTGVERLADLFLDSQVRVQTSRSATLAAVADAYSTLETSLSEPGENGLSSQLTAMWSGWHDVANTPDKSSTRAVLLERSTAVADRIGDLYSAARTQWSQARTTSSSLVDQVNATAAGVADLNGRILAMTNSGGNANELVDQRSTLVTRLSGLVGGSARQRADGQLDVLVGGNALVQGTDVRTMTLDGAASYEQAVAGTAVTVSWTDGAGSVGLDGGRIAGLLTVLGPPDATGTGGALAEAGVSYDALATQLAGQVNALHSAAVRTDGTAGGDFFTFDAGQPAATGLRVAITDPAQIAAAAAGQGAYDGSVADRVAQLGISPTGPDSAWSSVVVTIGARAAGATSRAQVAEVSRASAAQQQLADAGVDTDEETVNMLAFQRAYEGSARVLTAIDQMLDTLINRTGVVGR